MNRSTLYSSISLVIALLISSRFRTALVLFLDQ